MTVVIIAGVLTFALGLLILGPFPGKAGRPQARGDDPEGYHRRALLRQLRDLDDDLAAGKLAPGDHTRLREPVEREAAAALSRKAQGPAGGIGGGRPGTPSGPATPEPRTGPATLDPRSQPVTASLRSRPVTADPRYGPATTGLRSGPATSRPRPDRGAGTEARRWSRRTATLLTLAAAVAGIAIVLVGAVSARRPGQTITGNSVAGVAPVAASPGASAPAGQSGRTPPTRKPPTRQQLAAVAAAEARVKQNPKDVSAHLTLAEAYAAAGASQLAAVEYLAVTRLDPANAEANTNLALLAFEVGRAAQGKAMVDHVLAADPKYPEALYVRGLISLMGLRRPRAAERDFSAYLAVAPFGSHRTAAATLLALAQSQDRR
jgi:cytochrome c-type biogenesis protein CcmH/NrfG